MFSGFRTMGILEKEANMGELRYRNESKDYRTAGIALLKEEQELIGSWYQVSRDASFAAIAKAPADRIH